MNELIKILTTESQSSYTQKKCRNFQKYRILQLEMELTDFKDHLSVFIVEV